MVQPASTGAEQGGRGHLTSAAGGRRPSVTRGSLVSGGSCLPTTELPSMSKGKALPSPDAAREQAAPQRSHRGRTEHQAVLQAISPLVFNKPFLERRIWGSWWAPPVVQRWLVFYLLWRYLDPGTQGTTLLFLEVESESQRGPSAARLSLPPTLSLCLSSPGAPKVWALGPTGARRASKGSRAGLAGAGQARLATSSPCRLGPRTAQLWLPSHTHSHHSLSTFPFQALPLQVDFQTLRSGLSLSPASPPPRSLEHLQGLKMNIQRSRLLPHIPYLRSQGAGCLIYIYIDLYVPPL